MIDQSVSFANPLDFKTFKEYYAHEELLFIEWHQDEAANRVADLYDQYPVGFDREINLDMEKWWNRKLRRFHDRLFKYYYKAESKAVKDRARQERRQRKKENAELIRQLEVAKCEIAGLKHLIESFQEMRCRECNGPR